MRKDDCAQNNIDLDLEDGYLLCFDSEEQDMDDAHKVFDELLQPLTLIYLLLDYGRMDLRTDEDAALSTREWSDSLTNIIVGDMLSDKSPDDVSSSVNPSQPPRNPYFLEQDFRK